MKSKTFSCHGLVAEERKLQGVCGGGLEEDGDSRLKGYILKEKLKGLKGCIKSWSKEKSEDVKTQYILCGRKMNELDVKGNEGVG